MTTKRVRATPWINRKPAANLHHATRYAERIKLPLNTFVTINLSKIDVEANESSEAFQKIVGERFAPWLRRTANKLKSVPPTYVWSLEAANENNAVHWVVHIPSTIKAHFQAAMRRWVKEVAGGEPDAQALKIVPVYNLPKLKSYVLKRDRTALRSAHWYHSIRSRHRFRKTVGVQPQFGPEST